MNESECIAGAVLALALSAGNSGVGAFRPRAAAE